CATTTTSTPTSAPATARPTPRPRATPKRSSAASCARIAWPTCWPSCGGSTAWASTTSAASLVVTRAQSPRCVTRAESPLCGTLPVRENAEPYREDGQTRHHGLEGQADGKYDATHEAQHGDGARPAALGARERERGEVGHGVVSEDGERAEA